MKNTLISELVWTRIVENQGQEFHQIQGKVFTYKIQGNSIDLQTTNRKIPKSDIEDALLLCPIKTTTELQHLQAPSYIYAIMMDDRICGKLW